MRPSSWIFLIPKVVQADEEIWQRRLVLEDQFSIPQAVPLNKCIALPLPTVHTPDQELTCGAPAAPVVVDRSVCPPCWAETSPVGPPLSDGRCPPLGC